MQGPELTSDSELPTREAVLALMSDRIGQWRLDEIEERLLRSGWSAHHHLFGLREGIELAVSRLLGSGELERVRPGVVRYAGSGGTAPADATSQAA
jgi:hypothetical protein